MEYLLKESGNLERPTQLRSSPSHVGGLRLVRNNSTTASASEHPHDVAEARPLLSVNPSRDFNEQGSQFDHYWLSPTRTVPIRAIDAECCQFLQDQPLTQREREILRLIVQGNSNAEIARKLYVSNGTVKTHLRKLFTKLAVRDRTQAAVFALRAGLVD